MHRCAVCQKQGKHRIQMFSTATQGFDNPLPTQITPDVWILATPISAPTATISLICPERPMEIVPIWQPLHILQLPTACSVTSANFYLPPRYETPTLNVNVFLDWANICAINVTALHFRVWQHMGRNHSDMDLQHLTTLPSIPVQKIYENLLNSSRCLTPFNIKPSEDSDTFWESIQPAPEYTFQL